MMCYNGAMEISVSTLKASCLQVIHDVDLHHHEVVITKRGKPIARIVPYSSAAPPSVLGLLCGLGRSHGDIIEPAESWDEA